MFCHDRYSLLFSERKNSTIVSTRARKRWGRKREEREQVIACTMIEYAAAVAGEKMASICQWYGGWGTSVSDAFAGVPCLTPLCRTLLHISEHHQMLALSLSAVSLWQSQKGRRAVIIPCGIPGVERLSAHA